MFLKAIFFLASLSPATAKAERTLGQVEAHCWNESVDNGSFLCQYLMLMGKEEGKEGWVVPELAAGGSDGQILDQAHFACERLGFSYSSGYELGWSEKETLLTRLEPASAFVFEGKGAFIQHLKCE